jgi:hypothetical protein
VTLHEQVDGVAREQPALLRLADDRRVREHLVLQIERGAAAHEPRELARRGTAFDLGKFRLERGAQHGLIVRGAQFLEIALPAGIDDRRVEEHRQTDLGLPKRAHAVREDHEEQIEKERHRGGDGHEAVAAEAFLRP